MTDGQSEAAEQIDTAPMIPDESDMIWPGPACSDPEIERIREKVATSRCGDCRVLLATIRGLRERIAMLDEQRHSESREADRATGKVLSLEKDLRDIRRCWQEGIGELNTPWRRKMAALVGDEMEDESP